MKVLVCGDRNWQDLNVVHDRLEKLPKGTIIIQGGATGADHHAKISAERLEHHIVEVPALWNVHGKAAGPIRNRVMLDLDPVLVIAFHSNLPGSRGTADTVREAKRRGIPVEVIK